MKYIKGDIFQKNVELKDLNTNYDIDQLFDVSKLILSQSRLETLHFMICAVFR